MKRTILVSFILWTFVISSSLDAAEEEAAQPPQEPMILLDSGISPEEVGQKPYLDYVRECCDLLVEFGTDRYGPKQTPVLVNILDVRTRTCPSNPLPQDESVRVVRRDRRGPAGANLYLDQPTYRTLITLSKLTGSPKYADFTRKSIGWYLENLVDDKGFIWWGYHRHYDVYKDEMTGHNKNHHEIHFIRPIWPILWDINPEAVTREIEAIWQWHVIDKETGESNRHGDGQHGIDFTFSGGEFIYAFSFLYSKTKDSKWLDRARRVGDYYWKARSTDTNLIPTTPILKGRRKDADYFFTCTPAQLGCRLLNSYELTSEETFKQQGLAYLNSYGKFGYDKDGKTFWATLLLGGRPLPGPRTIDGYDQYFPRGHLDVWQPYAGGYERPLALSQTYAYAAERFDDDNIRRTARHLEDYLQTNWPPRGCAEVSWYAWYAKQWAPHGTYAEHYGRTVSFHLQMYKNSGYRNKEHLARAQAAADEAISKLYYKGLFRGHPCKPYYESIDGVGYLLNALLQLHQVVTEPENPDLEFSNW